jgi:hypothetical protein
MKKLTPFLTALLFTLCFIFVANGLTHAQKYTYKPLALEGVHWWVGFYNTNNPPWAETDHYQYVLRGDSTINDITYKKIYFRDITDSIYHYIESEVFVGLVRDDTLHHKV